eukprot:453799_1
MHQMNQSYQTVPPYGQFQNYLQSYQSYQYRPTVPPSIHMHNSAATYQIMNGPPPPPPPSYNFYHSHHMNPRVSSHRKHKTRIKYKDMESWLRARKLSDVFDNKYFHNNPEFMLKIITTIFDNYKNLIYHIINTISGEKRNTLCEIFNTEQLENDYNISETKQENIDDQKEIKISYFDRLSLTSISNICGYLNKKDIKRFKRTCSMIAIQCFSEMKKYSIGLFVSNDFNVNYKYKYLSIASTLYSTEQFKYDRYPKSLFSNKSLLIDMWCHKYKIQPKNILLARNNDTDRDRYQYPFLQAFGAFNDSFMLSPLTYFIAQYNASETNRVIIMDKTDLIFIGFDGEISSEKIIDEITNSQTLLTLYTIQPMYYFNIKQQHIQFLRLLIIPKESLSNTVMILECVQKNLSLFFKHISDKNTNEFMNMYNNAKAPKQSMQIDVINGLYVFGLYDKTYLHDAYCDPNVLIQQTFYTTARQCANQTHIVQRLKLRKEHENMNNKYKSNVDIISIPKISTDDCHMEVLCEVYSRTNEQWFDGRITDRFIDAKTNEEWFVVKYADNKTKKMQRFCTDLRIKNMDTTFEMKDEQRLTVHCEKIILSEMDDMILNYIFSFLNKREMNDLILVCVSMAIIGLNGKMLKNNEIAKRKRIKRKKKKKRKKHKKHRHRKHRREHDSPPPPPPPPGFGAVTLQLPIYVSSSTDSSE